MKPRKYIDRIEIYETTYVSDGFGGQVLGDPVLLGSSWCYVKTLRAERATDLGLVDNNLVIEIDLRYRRDLEYRTKDMYFVYKGIQFNPIRIEHIDLQGFELKIIAVSNSNGNG